MPLLAGLFVSLLGAVASWLGQYLTRKAANYVAMTVATAAAFAACWITIRALLTTATMAMPAEVGTAMSWCMPANVDLCISIRLGVEAALAGYRWHKDTVRAAAAVV